MVLADVEPTTSFAQRKVSFKKFDTKAIACQALPWELSANQINAVLAGPPLTPMIDMVPWWYPF
jgi:hypothetical protein